MSARRRLLGGLSLSLALLVLLSLAIEGLASMARAWSDRDSRHGIAEQAHCVYDPLLGWVNRKSFHAPDLYGPGRSLTTNERGFRSLSELTPEVPAGRHRMVFVGDSFTLGYGVDDAETFPARIEALAPAIQTVNMGQGGYGVDQAVLWYLRDGVQLDADSVTLVFIAPDFDRITEARFQDRYPKPLLRVVDGELRLAEDPVPDDWTASAGGPGGWLRNLAVADLLRRIGRRSGRPAPPAELPYREVAEKLLADLERAVSEKGAELSLVLIPLQDRAAGNPRALMQWLSPYAGSLGVPLHDLTGDFDELSPGVRDAYYAEDGHLNPLGNRFVAERLLRQLGPEHPLD